MHLPLKILVTTFRKWKMKHNSCVVNEYIQSSKLLLAQFDSSGPIIFQRYIVLHCHCVATLILNSLGSRSQALFLQIGCDHYCAQLSEIFRRLCADTIRSTCYDGYFAG